MPYTFPTGAGMFLANKPEQRTEITSITNADPALVELKAATNFAVGDTVLLETPTWSHCSNRIFRIVAVQQSRRITLEGLDTSDKTLYPAGTGAAGSFMSRFSQWVEIPQVLSYVVTGGEHKQITVSPLTSNTEISYPAGYTARTMEFSLGYHSSYFKVYDTFEAITLRMMNVVLKVSSSCGSTAYYYGPVSFRRTQSMDKGEPNKVMLAFFPISLESHYLDITK